MQISGPGLLCRRRHDGGGVEAFQIKGTSIGPDLSGLSVSMSISELGPKGQLPEARMASTVTFMTMTMMEINELSVMLKGQEGTVWFSCRARMRIMAINARSMVRLVRTPTNIRGKNPAMDLGALWPPADLGLARARRLEEHSQHLLSQARQQRDGPGVCQSGRRCIWPLSSWWDADLLAWAVWIQWYPCQVPARLGETVRLSRDPSYLLP
jgi:hypothetical protein